MEAPKQPETPPGPAQVLKPVDTTQVILAVFNLFKEIGALVALAMMEWARVKQHKAEDKAAVAETELAVLQQKVQIEGADAKKDPRDVVSDFLRQ